MLGETEGGLSGSEIGQLLRTSQVDDPQPTITKWTRIFEALFDCQQKVDRKFVGKLRYIHRACPSVREADRRGT